MKKRESYLGIIFSSVFLRNFDSDGVESKACCSYRLGWLGRL